MFGCLGNHEILAEAEDYVEHQGMRLDLRFLRQANASLRFGSARLNIAGVDYQRKNRPYLDGVESLRRDGELNLLLSHNPDVFPVASGQGWDVTLAGQTHGGQVTVEYLHPSLNPARYFTPYTGGIYRRAGRTVYVSSGLGTVGVPVRIGAEPEIALVRLSASRVRM